MLTEVARPVTGTLQPAAAHREFVDSERMHRVAADPDAAPAEIVAVSGSARRVTVAGNGSLLLQWTAESDDDEGPSQSAWRLYSRDFHLVAEGRKGAQLGAVGTADGFVLTSGGGDSEDYLLLPGDGKITPLPAAGAPARLARGDVLVSLHEPLAFARPTDGSVHRVSPPPRGDGSGYLTVDPDNGTLWSELGRHGMVVPVLHRTVNGSWITERLPVPAHAFPDGHLLTAGSATVVLPVSGPVPGDPPEATIALAIRQEPGGWSTATWDSPSASSSPPTSTCSPTAGS